MYGHGALGRTFAGRVLQLITAATGCRTGSGSSRCSWTTPRRSRTSSTRCATTRCRRGTGSSARSSSGSWRPSTARSSRRGSDRRETGGRPARRTGAARSRLRRRRRRRGPPRPPPRLWRRPAPRRRPRGGREPEPTAADRRRPEATTEIAPSTAANSADAAPSGREPALVPVADDFDSPVLAIAPPDDPRTFVVEQTGRIWILQDGQRRLETPFLDLSAEIDAGRRARPAGPGLRARLRVLGPLRRQLHRRRRQHPRRAVPRRGRPAPTPPRARSCWRSSSRTPTTTAATSCSGPTASSGSARATAAAAATPRTARRIRARCSARCCASTSISRRPEPEVWALGLRNPWRYSFDPDTGDLWIGDVGQGAIEEIDHVPSTLPAGVNFGWRRFEGTQRFDDEPAPDDLVAPVAEYSHDDGGCSVTGGVVVRDGGAWDGRYLYGDYCSGKLWTLDADAEGAEPVEVTDALGGPLAGPHVVRPRRAGPRAADGRRRPRAAPGLRVSRLAGPRSRPVERRGDRARPPILRAVSTAPEFVYQMHRVDKFYGPERQNPEGHLAVVPAWRQDRRPGAERRGQVDAAAHHGRPRGALQRQDLARARRAGRLPVAGARARRGQGRARQRRGRRAREARAARPLHRARPCASPSR